jgi:glycosyltransferase involved in cell wall biosynthesis
MQAMLHGIPVIASNAGGLVEAKMGTAYIVPVHGIERYEPVFDEHGLPRPIVPPQKIEPWADAFDALLGDRELYKQVSASSRQAALRFVNGLDAGRMAEYLEALARGESVAEPLSLVSLSPAKRALLLQRMRKG